MTTVPSAAPSSFSYRKRRYRHASIELNDALAKEQHDRRCVQLLRKLFKIPDVDLQDWPGALVFFHHMTEQYELSRETIIDPFLSMIHRKCSPPLPDVHDLVEAAAITFSTIDEDDASLNEFLEALLRKYAVSRIDMPSGDVGTQFTFSAVCWLTALHTPCYKASDSLRISVHQKQTGLRPHQSMDGCNRPVPGLLRSFGNVLPSAAAEAQHSELLHVSVLNFDTLSTIGKVRIEWIDSITAHLEFHPLSRTLLMYRFPTMCALHCLGEERSHCANRLLRSYFPNNGDSVLILTAFRREMLLSYRLIFGQYDRARKIYNSKERTVGNLGNNRDPFLDLLCGKDHGSGIRDLPAALWPESCLDGKGLFQEQDAYSAETDFPLLGSRILKLQEFSLRQSPTRIRDLWRDRRNPLQWYTFWAVLILGSVSLFLTFIQVLLAITQVVLSIK